MPTKIRSLLATSCAAVALACAASSAVADPQRDGATPARTSRPADPVLDSFARMLAHEPSWNTPSLPEGASTDPLIAAVVWPLLRSKLYTLAGAASAVRL